MAEFTWSSQQDNIFKWGAGRGTLTATLMEHLWESERPAWEYKNLVVRARAGTGKTTTLIELINRMWDKRILLAAFNKPIAMELRKRIRNPNAEAKTLHSVGFSIVRRFWEGIGMEEEGSYARSKDIVNYVCGGSAPDAMKRLVSNLQGKAREITPHATKREHVIDLAYSFQCVPEEQWENAGFSLDWVLDKTIAALEYAASAKPTLTGIDFSDQIFLPCRHHWMSAMYDAVLIDEGQDMTGSQLEIALGVCTKDGRIGIVGDDRQGIYAFRGADTKALDRLKETLGAGELGLTKTRRCPKAVVAMCQTIVPDFECEDDAPDGYITTTTKELLMQTAEPGTFVISRTNAPLVEIAMGLLRRGRRAAIKGKDIGKGLLGVVHKLKARSVPDYLGKVKAWQDRETIRLKRAGKEAKVENINDTAEMLIMLADGAKNVDEICDRVVALFKDDGLGTAGVVTCSSIHRVKGLEAEKIYILADTLRPSPEEELNLQYVAMSRTKHTLVWVH